MSKCEDFTIVRGLLDVCDSGTWYEINDVNIRFNRLLEADLVSVRERIVTDGGSTVVLDYLLEQANQNTAIYKIRFEEQTEDFLIANRKLERVYSLLQSKYFPIELMRKFAIEIYPVAKSISRRNEDAKALWDLLEFDFVFSEHT